MTKQKLNEVLEVMANKASIANIAKAEGTYKNMRECPIYSELHGMEQMLKIMGIEFEYEFNDEVTKMTAIKAKGMRVEIA